MIRQHDVQVLAEGTFRVVLTNDRRVVTAIDIPDSALGPLHLAFVVAPEASTASTFTTAGLFGDVGRAVGHVTHDASHLAAAGEATFNAASKVASTVARPAFDITRDAAAASASLVARIPLPEAERARIEAASRTIMRARMGDLTAQGFVRAVGDAAKAGVEGAQRASEALAAGSRIVSHVVDGPLAQLERVPGLGTALHTTLDPIVKLGGVAGALRRGDFEGLKRIVEAEAKSPAAFPLRHLAHAANDIRRGDFRGLKRMIENDARAAASIVAYVPGIGTGVSAALNAGLAVLDGGGAIDVAIHAAYGALPIPPGVKNVTDAVLDSVLSLLHHPKGLTDAILAGARSEVPEGFPRHVFDTLAHVVIHHVPIAHAAEELVSGYVQRYAPELSGALGSAGGVSLTNVVAKVQMVKDAAQHVAPQIHVDPRVLLHAAGAIGARP